MLVDGVEAYATMENSANGVAVTPERSQMGLILEECADQGTTVTGEVN